ncbi:uncharacterized protein LOC143195096 [Rhynchophorus ferrugineus]|uniref:uncharacterized protein LOC143195096 n=1 Tax=Rhynchophorus ferrugineus TaxID=354439 RepID=UPI003FCE7CE0
MEPYTTFEAIADIISCHISVTFPIGNTFVNSRTFEDPLTFISNEYLVCNVTQGPAKYFRAAFETNRSTHKRNITRAVRTKFDRVPVDVKLVFNRVSYYCTERNIAYTPTSSVVRPKQRFALVKCNPLTRRSSTEVFKCLHRRYDRTTDASLQMSRSSVGITHLRRRNLRMKKYLVSADFLSITTIQQELIYNRNSLFHDSQEF